jgi:phytanoyl-CoA hydroxylase
MIVESVFCAMLKSEDMQTLPDESAPSYPPDLYRFGKSAAGIQTLADVSDDQLDAFRASGYLIIERGFGPDRLESALLALTDLALGGRPDFNGIEFESWASSVRPEPMQARERLDAVRKLWSFVDYDERLRGIALDPALLAVVRRLLRGEPRMFQDMALFKPPGGGREKPWHQDLAYFDLDVEEPVVGVWIALDQATPENGCMHIIPGSHRRGPVTHFQRRDWQICDTDVEVRSDVMVPLEPGGVLLFDGLLHHGTPANRTGTRRRSLQFHYAAMDARQVDTAHRLDIFGSDGRDVSC